MILLIILKYVILLINILLDIYGGSVGLALTQVITLLGRIQWGVRQSTVLLCQLTSVDRVLEYTHLPQEDTLQPIKGKI